MKRYKTTFNTYEEMLVFSELNQNVRTVNTFKHGEKLEIEYIVLY